MKIMLIEDEEYKAKDILAHLREHEISDDDVIHVKNMNDFAAQLARTNDVGLFIIDIKIPGYDKGVASQNGTAILEIIVKAGMNDALMLTISSYPVEFPDLRNAFESQGCILADFNNREGWRSTLDQLLVQLKKSVRLDFVIFCALREERDPYTVLTPGKLKPRGGIDCFDIAIGRKRGTVVLLPRMGLVNAAIVAGVCIDRYKPKVVALSGICGGFKDRAKLGELLISSTVYEYQSGKWAPDGFQHEPYQVSTDHLTLLMLETLASGPNLLSELEDGFPKTLKRPAEPQQPRTAVFTSGSAVIADGQFLNEIEGIHRKVAGLDMEVFAIQRAAELASHKPPCICAKTVVDLCDKKKNDALHQYGSFISAKFILKAIDAFFKSANDRLERSLL